MARPAFAMTGAVDVSDREAAIPEIDGHYDSKLQRWSKPLTASETWSLTTTTFYALKSNDPDNDKDD